MSALVYTVRKLKYHVRGLSLIDIFHNRHFHFHTW